MTVASPYRRRRESLTVRQAHVLSIIRDTIAERGVSPTGRELAEQLGCSRRNAHIYLDVLIEKRCIVRDGARPGRMPPSRTLRLVVPGPGPARVDLASAVFACEVGGRFVTHEGVAYKITAAERDGR